MSRFLCLFFFAAAKKVSAAPHRGNANRPISIQGKAKKSVQGKPTAAGKQPNPPPQANNSRKAHRNKSTEKNTAQGQHLVETAKNPTPYGAPKPGPAGKKTKP
ncbi:hypothetical protein [Paraburkholderia sp. RL17-337-BIB-A]|uniref:hypothetical protein n=1 Tax=Paraburkholderia sp. RL17-337-BIB-A TaxID=3031636 RepID=UPI0038BD5A7F